MQKPDHLRDPSRAELPGLVKRGLGWKLASQISTHLTRTLVTVILARLLIPHDFGLAGMVIVMSAFVIPFADLGLGVALIQKKKIDEVDRSSVFWASVVIGALFTLGGIAISPLVAAFYHEPRAEALFAALSLMFLATALGSTHRSLLVRAMDFRNLELRLMLSIPPSAAIAIWLALEGYGPWAIVAQQLSSTAISTALLWLLMDWRPRATFSWARIRDLGTYGGRFVGAIVFTSLNQNTDNILVGRYLGAHSLGVYSLCYSVILVPLSRLVGPIQQVFYPALARMQDDPAGMARTWLRVNRMVAAVSVPLLLILSLTAPEAVPAVFGEHWSDGAPVLRILALVSLLQCLQALHPVMLEATNRMSTYLRFSAISFVVNLGAFVIGLRWGVVGVAAAFAVSSACLAVVFTVIASRAVSIPPLAFLRSLEGLWQPTAALLAVSLATVEMSDRAELRPWPEIFLVGSLGLAAYLAVAAVTARDLWQELRRFTGRSGARRVGAEPAVEGSE